MQFFIFGLMIPSFFILTGAGLLFIGVRTLRRATASNAWPTADGMIQRSSVRTQSGSSISDPASFYAEVLYDYTVGGATFSGNRIAFAKSGGFRSSARRILNTYPKGKEVTVYYAPDDPEISVLEPGKKLGTWYLPVGGLAFIVAGIWFVRAFSGMI